MPNSNESLNPSDRRWIDSVADRFEAMWRAALPERSVAPPRVEDFLAESDESRRAALLYELIGLDIDYRRLRGEPPRPEDYLDRFPSLDRAWLKSALALPGDAELPNDPAFPQTRARRIRCPHCQVVIELVDAVAGSDVICSKCGSVFSSATATVLNPVSADPPEDCGRSPTEPPRPTAGLPQATSHAEAPEEKRFGRFRLLGDKPLGMGSFGEVWRAHDPKLQREVALKFPRPGKQKNFLREAEAAARLKHPHIVTVFEVGEAAYHGREKWPYIASELIHGRDLAKLLKAELERGRALAPKRVAELCRQVAEALHAAHEAGVTHRDLKSQNILIDDHDQPYVMDFGMAKRETEAGYVQSMEGDVFGTPAYMSPEQTRDSHAVDRRTDIWALGIILFELLTGERPFRGERDQKLLLDQIRSEDPPPPSKLNSQVPADFDTLCLKCLEKDPSRRFPTAAALAQELHRFLHGEPIHSRPITQWERASKWCQRNPAVASLSAAVVLVLITGTAVSSFFAFQSNRKAEEARLNLYCAHMNLAQRNWEDAKVGLLIDLLEQTRPQPGETDLRGFEWYYWDRLCHSSLLDLKGHIGGVRSVAFSPDGKRLASASLDQTVKVWDATSGAESFTLQGHTGFVFGVAFSPDGKRLASASRDQTMKVWDATSGAESLTLTGHTGEVESVAFSPDGKRLASASEDETVKVWDATSGAESLTLKGHTGGVSSVAFSPDGKRLASACGEIFGGGEVKVWDATSGQETLTLIGHEVSASCVVFSADGKRLASASQDGTVKVWDATNGQETLTLKGHTGGVRSVAFSADGRRLASARQDGTVKVWDATSGAESLTLKGHTGELTSVAFSPDGKRLVSASDDGTVKVWDATSGQETLTLKGHSGWVTSVAFSPDGKRLASASGDQTVKVWDARPWTPELRAEREALSLLHFLRDQGQPQSEWLNALSSDQTISEAVRQRALQFAREWKPEVPSKEPTK